jgi:ribose-phosphate pyrophosphokinase
MIFLNDTPVIPTVFPDLTSQVWKLDDQVFNRYEEAKIIWNFEHEGEFMGVAQLVTLLKYNGVHDISLKIPYLPYGRQDKSVSNGSTFALYPFAKLLNTLGFKSVEVFDPHSGVAFQLIENLKIVTPVKEVYLTAGLLGADTFLYPDKGAKEKYTKIFDFPFITGKKDRDQSTGKIISLGVEGDCKGKRVLIVDDICDGGGTFVGLADVLLMNGAKEVNLYVSHGIFSKGTQVLLDAGIKRIFTRNGEVDVTSNQPEGFLQSRSPETVPQ